jgi:hypothetical protein
MRKRAWKNIDENIVSGDPTRCEYHSPVRPINTLHVVRADAQSLQRLSLQASFALFMEPKNGKMLPEHGVIKSPAALSRFFNEYGLPTRAVIRTTRQQILKQLSNYTAKGQRPYLQIIDLTTLEKRGKFKAFATLIHIRGR